MEALTVQAKGDIKESAAPGPDSNPSATTTDSAPQGVKNTFEKLDLQQTSETFQHLKPAGSAFSDFIGVPKYLVSRAIEKIGDMYTDYRLTQAATQLATFKKEVLDPGASANSTLKTWDEMANKNELYKVPMQELNGAIAEIIKAQIEGSKPIRERIDSALLEIQKASSIDDFASPGAAATLRDLPLEEKKKILGAYDTLRTSLTSLESIAHATGEQATAFYHTASACFERHDAFSKNIVPTLHTQTRSAYKQEVMAIHESYVAALKGLASSSTVSAPAISDVGAKTLERLENLQKQAQALSDARIAADACTAKLDQTLSYLSNGVESGKSLETESNQKFVTVSDNTADALVGYVKAKTAAERNELAAALKSKDLAGITAATEALQQKSDEVHANLSEAAKLLSKVNAGYDQTTNTAIPDQAEQILTLLRANKMSEEDIAAVKDPVHGFVKDIREKLEARITKIFSADANGGPEVTPAEQKEIQILAAYADDLLEQVKRMKEPTKEQITSEIKVSERSLKEALSPQDRDEEQKLAEKAARIKGMVDPEPTKKPWWKFW